MNCPACNGETFKHLHNEAHGLSGTHMDGSERYECQGCKKSIYAKEGAKLGFKFFLDTEYSQK